MSRTRLQVVLSDAEDNQLYELRDADDVPKRTKQRAEMLRLSHRSWTTEQIAEYLNCRVETVRRAIHRWHDVRRHRCEEVCRLTALGCR